MPTAAKGPAGNNGDAPMLATNKARKAGSIIAIGNGIIDVDVVNDEPA